MKKIIFSFPVIAAITCFQGCGSNSDPVSGVDTTLNTSIISNFSVNVASAEYVDLYSKTSTLYAQSVALASTPTEDQLSACRQTWRDARKIWEQSEAQLFGPVETENIDPHIDSWPVDYNALNFILNSENEFTTDYINNLDDALKGFHPIEYILFGKDGSKKAADLTPRELQFLAALTLNVKTLTGTLNDIWNPSSTSDFYADFSKAGNGSSTYTTQASALEELVGAMADICDEVANSKMETPYLQQDPGLEESPFAQSSMTDFINNITGIQNVYLGKYTNDGAGIEDIVKKYNLSLDAEIKTKLSAALTAMAAIDEPFGKAIIDEHTKIETAMTAINDLHDSLDKDLLPFIKQHSK